MFTGLIQSLGTVAAVETTPAGSRLQIECGVAFMGDVTPGDSIALDGVCTTVVAQTATTFSIEATPETLSKTLLGAWQTGRRVNLEKPLLPTSRLGGHFVSGHVDGLATVLARYEEGNSVIFRFLLTQPQAQTLLIPKGSVALNGISLTLNEVAGPAFTVAIIPHTLAHTNLGDVQVDDRVHVELDILGKYVHRLLGAAMPGLPAEAGATGAGKTRLHAGWWFCHDEAIHGEYGALIEHWDGKPTITP
ncbi:MAG: riboflavin synthase [Candidatus Melainabacteria bacterium]